jgi:pyruvate,orthophosphate dikinase
MFPHFDAKSGISALTKGLGASPGAAVGEIVFDNASAIAQWEGGQERASSSGETNPPEDLEGMIASVGVLTARGGKTSHAAVVARGMGMCAVVGAEAMTIEHLRADRAGRRHPAR